MNSLIHTFNERIAPLAQLSPIEVETVCEVTDCTGVACTILPDLCLYHRQQMEDAAQAWEVSHIQMANLLSDDPLPGEDCAA